MDDAETLELNTDYNTVDTGGSGAQPRNLDIAAVPGEDRWFEVDEGIYNNIYSRSEDPATPVVSQPSGRGWYYVIPGLARPRPRLLLYQLPYFHYSFNLVNTGL